MEIKKSKSARLDVHSRTFFLIGLSISLSLVLLAFEFKSERRNAEIVELGKSILWDDPQIQNTVRPIPKVVIPKLDLSSFKVIPEGVDVVEIDITSLLAHDAGMVWVLDTAEYVEELYDEPTVAFPEIMSEYPGGESALRKFLLANMNYPAQAKDFGLEGTVYIKFTVSSAGVVKDVQIERGVDPLLDHEAIRVVSMMPDWIPAQQGIRKVATYIHLPVKFSLRK